MAWVEVGVDVGIHANKSTRTISWVRGRRNTIEWEHGIHIAGCCTHFFHNGCCARTPRRTQTHRHPPVRVESHYVLPRSPLPALASLVGEVDVVLAMITAPKYLPTELAEDRTLVAAVRVLACASLQSPALFGCEVVTQRLHPHLHGLDRWLLGALHVIEPAT